MFDYFDRYHIDLVAEMRWLSTFFNKPFDTRLIFAIWAAMFDFFSETKSRNTNNSLSCVRRRSMFSLFDLLLTHKIDNGLFMGKGCDKKRTEKIDWSFSLEWKNRFSLSVSNLINWFRIGLGFRRTFSFNLKWTRVFFSIHLA